jgi:hypothetical protein
METGIEDLAWVNYAMFVGEWQSSYDTGLAKLEIFEISTGGRLDGETIPALEPPYPQG